MLLLCTTCFEIHWYIYWYEILKHHPVAGKITPRTIACSTTSAIKYCFKVIFYPFRKAFCLTEYI